MTDKSDGNTRQNYFDRAFARLTARGMSGMSAVECIAGDYLDGKPQKRGKNKLTKRERDSLFWSSGAITECPPGAWGSQDMVLALSRYLRQQPVAIEGLLTRVAREHPAALIRAVRYSGLVLEQRSPRRAELQVAAAASPDIADLCRALDAFHRAHDQRLRALEVLKERLDGLSAFDLLIYAGLHAFERLVPRDFKAATSPPAAAKRDADAWAAISDLLAWKLGTKEPSSLKLTEHSIGASLSKHLRPILFEAGGVSTSAVIEQLKAFHRLLAAQIELNEFIGRAADAFSYDDGMRFVMRGDHLEMIEVDPGVAQAWLLNGRKLERLHGYWFHRALDEFAAYIAVDPTRWEMGTPENAQANRLALARALQAQLRLREVYGVADTVVSDTGDSVDLFRALLSLELMSVFFQRDFLAAYMERLENSGDWITALQRLAFDGLCDNMQIRMPLTWSDRDAKIRNITAWTVSASDPKGSPKMAAAILDFWTYDMVGMADRLQGQTRQDQGREPHLFERPVLKFGSSLVQLPWIVGLQNNSSAAINNLRRLGARRGQTREETQRIETSLAALLQERGFRTLLNWQPPRGEDDPGEVDLVAVQGGHLFVMEVKSTFLRRSDRDAWIHANTTLRKAGRQVRRKVDAVLQAAASDSQFRERLGLTAEGTQTHHHGWIVDTSIECDHQRFGDYLKISLEELLIALRDDRHLLNDPGGLLAGEYDDSKAEPPDAAQSTWSLYPAGFSVDRFVEVIETEAVWGERSH